MERLKTLEPKDPIAYPQYPMRPAGARRPVYQEQRPPQKEPAESRSTS